MDEPDRVRSRTRHVVIDGVTYQLHAIADLRAPGCYVASSPTSHVLHVVDTAAGHVTPITAGQKRPMNYAHDIVGTEGAPITVDTIVMRLVRADTGSETQFRAAARETADSYLASGIVTQRDFMALLLEAMTVATLVTVNPGLIKELIDYNTDGPGSARAAEACGRALHLLAIVRPPRQR